MGAGAEVVVGVVVEALVVVVVAAAVAEAWNLYVGGGVGVGEE